MSKLDESGQAGAELGQRKDKALKAFERFRDDIGAIEQRWENRLVLKRTPRSEAYIDGRMEILLYGDWIDAENQIAWACRVEAKAAAAHLITPKLGKKTLDAANGNGGQHEVVLVVVINPGEAPNRLVPSTVRSYLFEKKRFSTRDSLIYQNEVGRGFELISFGSDGKMSPFRGGANRSDCGGCEVVKGGPEVVDRISDYERQRFRDWFERFVSEAKTGVITVQDHGVSLNPNVVKIARERAGYGPEFVNVAVGPFNL